MVNNLTTGEIVLMDQIIKEALASARTIAVVGLSDREDRPSHDVAKFLQAKGYRIIPVNPRLKEVLGEKAYPDLMSIPEKIDLVDVFRKSEDVPPIARQALEKGPKYFWMQEGIENSEAKSLLQDGGILVIMDRCMKKEIMKLEGKL